MLRDLSQHLQKQIVYIWFSVLQQTDVLESAKKIARNEFLCVSTENEHKHATFWHVKSTLLTHFNDDSEHFEKN